MKIKKHITLAISLILMSLVPLTSCGSREGKGSYVQDQSKEENVSKEASGSDKYEPESNSVSVSVFGKTAGEYVPSCFSWSGGSGKVDISCDKVMVPEDTSDETVALITFSSPSYDYVRIGDVKITGEHTDSTSTFSVPVQLDTEMELIGCTSAMSRPHEISYTIFISVDEDSLDRDSARKQGNASGHESEGKTGGTAVSDLSGKAPEDSSVRKKIMDTVRNESEAVTFLPPDITGLSFDHSMDLEYARCFAVHYYKDGFKVLSVIDGSNYLLVPEGAEVPEKLPEGMVIIKKPIDNVYLAATGAMSLFSVLDRLSLVKFTGTDISGWDIEAPVEALKSGKMTYAGRYSAPDYEMLIEGDCGLAIESTMILHSPEVKEELLKVGIPVFTDWSSYETSAQGRTEWVKLYGAMTDKEREAESFFRDEIKASGIDSGFDDTGKKVAFFYINSRGLAVIRSTWDYIPKMIRQGGGEYVFDSVASRDNESVSKNISMEEFFESAVDADYIIYNGSIDRSVLTLEELLAKSELLSAFKAVKEDNVYIVDRKFYQSTDTASEFVRDIHYMLTGEDSNMVFLKKLGA